MDKPPTKAKPSAEPEHTPEPLRARLLELAGDYFHAYRESPTEENLDTYEVLAAVASSPERREQLANELRQLRNREAGTDHMFWRRVWLKQVPLFTAYHDGDPEAVARDLIVFMPAELRVRCPAYPTSEAELERAVAAVLGAKNFRRQVAEWVTGEQDVLKVARAVLRGLDQSASKAKSLFRSEQWAELASELASTAERK